MSGLFGVGVPPTLFSDNLTDAVKEPSVARSEGTLVVDHLNLVKKNTQLIQISAERKTVWNCVWPYPPSPSPLDTPPGWLLLYLLPNHTGDSACCLIGLWHRALGCSASQMCQTCEGQQANIWLGRWLGVETPRIQGNGFNPQHLHPQPFRFWHWLKLNIKCSARMYATLWSTTTSLQTWVWSRRAASWGLDTVLWGRDPARSAWRSRLHTNTNYTRSPAGAVSSRTPVTHRCLCIWVGWPSRPAAAGSSRTQWGRWCRSRSLLQCHLNNSTQNRVRLQPLFPCARLFLNVVSGETLRDYLQGAADSRAVSLCGHTVASGLTTVHYTNIFYIEMIVMCHSK